MESPYVDIHTHRPTGRGIELRTTGIHPWEAGRRPVASLLPLDPNAQAVGEIGLDFLRGPARAVQQAVFEEQLRLAEDSGLPAVIHCVRAFAEVMRTLARYRLPAVIFHGFIGSPEQAREALGRGYCLSYGERTFRSPKTLGALRATPLAQLFLETDDGTTPIGELYARTASLLGMEEERLRRATEENYKRIFIHE